MVTRIQHFKLSVVYFNFYLGKKETFLEEYMGKNGKL